MDDDGLATVREDLSRFARIEGQSAPDTFVLPVLGCGSTTVPEWAVLLRQLLTGLNGPGVPPVTEDGDFVFAGTRFFVMLLAPCYGDSHPRASGMTDTACVLFHPERAFRRFHISSRRPRRDDLSRLVEERFAARGRGYDLRQVTDVPKVLRYIKPHGRDDPPVAWSDADRS